MIALYVLLRACQRVSGRDAGVSSVLDCASYIRGRHFVLECDHQALKPLFQKQLKGAIYERWLAILQQFDLDIERM
jgi:hypothetical protein